MKIDIYAHIIPPEVKDLLLALDCPGLDVVRSIPTLWDMDERFRIMDKYPGMVQVITFTGASPDRLVGTEGELDLTMRINDGLAGLVYKYPDRFAAGVAVLPMRNMDAALKELERCVNDLKLRGVELRIPINGKPVDRPEFFPLYEAMCKYNLPIWWHPQKTSKIPDYPDESESKYVVWHMWGLPYETTVSMTRMVFGGVLERFPNLKIITHHCGGMVPYFAQRIVNHYNQREMRNKYTHAVGLTQPHIEYFRKFYNDTAILGNTSALMCAYDFFGAEHILFGTDTPYDPQVGDWGIRQTIEGVEGMDIPASDKKKIFEDNARKLLRLPI